MSESSRLDQLIVVRPRFTRSISLVRDAQRQEALEGYILTPTGRDVLRRITDALRGDLFKEANEYLEHSSNDATGFLLIVDEPGLSWLSLTASKLDCLCASG